MTIPAGPHRFPGRLGLLGARADRGGLAAQTREFHRHLHPDRTLVMDLGDAGRGSSDLSWYPGATVVHGDTIPADVLDRFLDGLDAVWAAETPYRDSAFARARALGVRSFLHVNPELWDRRDRPDVLLAPTSWRLPRGATVLPFPVARDRLPYRQRTEARTFVHVAAPAMADRNGTRLVLEAMRHVRRPIRLLLLGATEPPPAWIGQVQVSALPEAADYWRAWPADGDVLLLPRRYAGQSLPISEALSLGMPVVSLDLEPQRAWLPPETLVPVTRSTPVRMKGGLVPVADADPRALACVVERLHDDPTLVARCSALADEHAGTISWTALLPRYLETFSHRP